MAVRGHGVWLAGWMLALAVGCTPASGGDGGSGGAAAACSWPASLDRSVASSGQCIAGRAYLSCSASDGSSELCLTDDLTQCPQPSATGQMYGNCHNLCDPQEYAVSCGGGGPGPWPSPPDGCRQLPPTPGGGTMSCCPCAAAGGT